MFYVTCCTIVNVQRLLTMQMQSKWYCIDLCKELCLQIPYNCLGSSLERAQETPELSSW